MASVWLDQILTYLPTGYRDGRGIDLLIFSKRGYLNSLSNPHPLPLEGWWRAAYS